jgi:hypothetical protein
MGWLMMMKILAVMMMMMMIIVVVESGSGSEILLDLGFIDVDIPGPEADPEILGDSLHGSDLVIGEFDQFPELDGFMVELLRFDARELGELGGRSDWGDWFGRGRGPSGFPDRHVPRFVAEIDEFGPGGHHRPSGDHPNHHSADDRLWNRDRSRGDCPGLAWVGIIDSYGRPTLCGY